MSKHVQDWQLCIICHLPKSQTVRLWMIFIILIANDWHQWVVCAWRYLPRSSIPKQIWIIWIRSKFIQFLVILTWPNQLTHPSTHTTRGFLHLSLSQPLPQPQPQCFFPNYQLTKENLSPKTDNICTDCLYQQLQSMKGAKKCFQLR